MYTKVQDRSGNGQFSTSKHVATNAQLDAAQRRRAQNDADAAKQAEVKALGLGDDVLYSDIFAA
jgi:hypothetical protein